MTFPVSADRIPPRITVPQVLFAQSQAPGWIGIWNPRPLTVEPAPETFQQLQQETRSSELSPVRHPNAAREEDSAIRAPGVPETQPVAEESSQARLPQGRREEASTVRVSCVRRTSPYSQRRSQRSPPRRSPVQPRQREPSHNRRRSPSQPRPRRPQNRSPRRPTRVVTSRREHSVQEYDREYDRGVQRTRTFRRSVQMVTREEERVSNRPAPPYPHRREQASSREPAKRRALEDLRVKLDRIARREEPPPKKQKTTKCPIQGCKMDAGGKLKRHLESHHIPGLFHQRDTDTELSSIQFQSLRRHALEMMADFLFGRGSRVEDLVEFVNSRMPREDTVVSIEASGSMDALASVSGWLRPERWSVSPVNSPAALIHWRPLSYLTSQLRLEDRQEMFLLFGDRLSVSEKEEHPNRRRRNRLNPQRRRLLLEEGTRPQSPIAKSAVAETTGSGASIMTPPVQEAMVIEEEPTKETCHPTPQNERSRPNQEDNNLSTRRLCLRDASGIISPSALSQFRPTEGLSLSLEQMGSPQLDYSGSLSPSPLKDPGLSKEEEEALLAVDSPKSQKATPMEIEDSRPIIIVESPSLSPSPTGEVNSESETTQDVQPSTSSEPLAERVNLTPAETQVPVGEHLDVPCFQGPKTYAEALTSRKRSPVGMVKPRVRACSSNEAFDSHFHLDRLSRQLHKETLEERTIFHQGDKPPTVPVTLCGGVMVFCDPKGYGNIPQGMDKRWKVAVGVHPKKIADLTEDRFRQLQGLLSNSSAFGEIGLDFHDGGAQRTIQLDALKRLLPLCKPEHVLVLHVRGRPEDRCSREAFAKCLDLVKSHVPSQQRIHLHCFTGDRQQVSSWTSSFPRCYFGFTGKAARFNRLQREGMRAVPWDRMLIETDSPYLPVHPDQSVNMPAYIGEVAEVVARIRFASTTEVLEQTTRNGRALYL